MVDWYTKAVLTVIAVALIGILAKGAIAPLHAQSGGVQKVVICTENGYRCASLVPFTDRSTAATSYGLQVGSR